MSKIVVVVVVVVVNYVIKLLLTIGVLDMWLCQMCGMGIYGYHRSLKN